jgi:putative DNA primase/helicase
MIDIGSNTVGCSIKVIMIESTNPLADIKTLRRTLGANGFLPIPVVTGDKKPYIKDWPRLAAKGAFIEAEPEFKTLNTGVLANGLRAVDIDIEDAALANAVRKVVVEKLGPAPMRWRSNSGKHLLLYRAADGEPEKVRLFNTKKKDDNGASYNIEVLGKGQQFVAFGSHPSGVNYEWDCAPSAFNRDELTPVTEQQIEKLLKQLRPAMWTENLLKKCCDELAGTAKGEGRDDTQNKQAFTMGGYIATGHISKERVVEKLYEAAVAAGRLELNTEADLRAHLERSVDEGAQSPLYPPTKERTGDEVINGIIGESGDAGGQSRFASAVVRLADGDIRYDPKLAIWYVWDGKVWQRNAEYLVIQMVKGLCDKVSIHLLAEDKKSEAASVVSIGFIRAVVEHAQSMAEVWIDSCVFDANKILLNTPECAIELDGYLRRKHSREDYCTKMNAVSPEAISTPLWDGFMVTAHDVDVAAFLMRWGAYCLSGLTHVRKFVFLYGPTGTGKSVFRETLLGIMGDYAAAINVDTITETYGIKNTSDIARTRGCRAVFCPEVDDRKLDEKTLKAFTGEDTMAVRLLYQNSQDYKGEAKLTFSGNHEPGLRNVDDSMRIRFIKVPCLKKPTAEQFVDQLQEKLKAEWPGILHKFILAYQDFAQNGLQIPVSVERATDEYFDEQDVLKAALEDRFTFETDGWTSLADIHAAVVAYGREHSSRELMNMKPATLGRRLEHDFELAKHKRNYGQGFYGIKKRYSGWENNSVFDATKVAPEQRSVIWPPIQP